MGSRNQVGIGLSYRPAMLHRLADLTPWDSIPELFESLKIGALNRTAFSSLSKRTPFPPLNQEDSLEEIADIGCLNSGKWEACSLYCPNKWKYFDGL
jgi:hypothetical protein